VYLAEKQYLVFSSHDISFEQDYQLKTHGCKFEYSVQPFLESGFDGIVLIKNFSKPDFHCKYRGELEDATLDEREPAANYWRGGTYLSQAENERLWAEQDRELGPVIKAEGLSEELQTGFDPDDGSEMDIWDIPEYQNMNPFDMNIITDETGTHDEYGICCEYGTCWIYESQSYKDYQRETYREEHQMELDFLNGLQKEEELSPREEVLLEV
jgi:hypothetical protein